MKNMQNFKIFCGKTVGKNKGEDTWQTMAVIQGTLKRVGDIKSKRYGMTLMGMMADTPSAHGAE